MKWTLVGIIADRGNIKHSLINRFEFGEMHAGTDVNYFDLMEDLILAWDSVAKKINKQ